MVCAIFYGFWTLSSQVLDLRVEQKPHSNHLPALRGVGKLSASISFSLLLITDSAGCVWTFKWINISLARRSGVVRGLSVFSG